MRFPSVLRSRITHLPAPKNRTSVGYDFNKQYKIAKRLEVTLFVRRLRIGL